MRGTTTDRVRRASAKRPVTPSQVTPKQLRSVQTRERLLDVAGELLGEVGIERISTNLISARAGMTPPALYRYFKDKYAVLEALGRRLMERQNDVLFGWLGRYAPRGLAALAEHTEELLHDTAAITAAEPGALWTLRALRAVPQLAHIRIDSHRFVTDRMTKIYAPLVPELPKKVLWRRLRMSIEFGYAADEMIIEETLLKRDDVIRETARLMQWVLTDPPSSPRKRGPSRKS
jgi:AcrR family transcriptional regulator